eukprot:2278574-Prymnesium_polylepis.1
MATAIVRDHPELMFQTHGEPIFNSETCIHTLVVSQRWHLLDEWLELACKAMGPEAVDSKLCNDHCTGFFFKNKPQIDYGGHAMAFACGFQGVPTLRKLIALGPRKWALCADKTTGCLPIHVAAKKGLIDVVELLVDMCKEENQHNSQLDNPQLALEVVAPGHMEFPRGYTALHVAVRAGQHKLTQRLFEYDVLRLWKWGNLSCDHLFLRPQLDAP